MRSIKNARVGWALGLSVLLYVNAGAADRGDADSAPSSDLSSTEEVRILGTAPKQAPSNTPLDALQPISIMGEEYIANKIPPSSDFSDIIRLAPSVFANAPNGSGASDGKITIRGFADGQYNVTFDGIPFRYQTGGHRSSTTIATHDLGALSVDRGPGTASTIGDGTFGGTLFLESKAPSADPRLVPYATVGSFSSHLYGTEIETGAIARANEASVLIDGEYFESDGYLTHSPQTRTNVFLKAQLPIGEKSALTFVALYNNEPISPDLTGASQAQIAMFGPNYGFSNDPTAQNYYKYYQSPTKTDFEYLGFKAEVWDGFSIDNKAYTNALYRHNIDALDSSGNTPNGTFYGPNDVPGAMKITDIRTWGDVLRLQDSLPFGDLKAGVWIDYQFGRLYGYNFDMSLGTGAHNPPTANAINYIQQFSLFSKEPYLEFDWKVTPNLTVTPGIKYAFFTVGENAQRNQGSKLPIDTNQNFSQSLPAIAANYRFSDRWAAYVEAAEGYDPPPINILYTKDPSLNTVGSQTTWNYQLGATRQADTLTMSADVYYIKFKNAIASRTVGGITTYFNQGGVTYKGVEGEGTVRLGGGFSFYANGSINSAKNIVTGQYIAEAPVGTAGGGLLYDDGTLSGSLIDKWVGRRYGDVGQLQPIESYNQLDFAAGYRFRGKTGSGWPRLTIKFEVTNLLDSTKINDFAGYSGGSKTPLFFTQVGRSYFLSLELPLSL